MRPFLVIAFVALLAAPALALPVAPANRGAAPALAKMTQHGVAFVTGGVGQAEQQELRGLQPDYNTRIVLTDRKGEYLDDLHVTVSDTSGKQLIDTTTHGPILMAQLQPGRYHLTAKLHGWTTEQRTIQVPAKHGEAQLYVALHKEANVG